MAWFRKEKKPRELSDKTQVAIPEGLWVKCDDCKEIVYRKEVEQNFSVSRLSNSFFPRTTAISIFTRPPLK